MTNILNENTIEYGEEQFIQPQAQAQHVDLSAYYDKNIFNNGTNAPPNYQKQKTFKQKSSATGLFQSIQTAQDQLNNRGCSIFRQCGTFMFCSITIVLILFILMAIPIIMLIIGSLSVNEYQENPTCNKIKFIPIWLIVAGGFMLLKNIYILNQRIKSLEKIKKTDTTSKISNTILNSIDKIVSVFLIAWFIFGNHWVFSNYSFILNESSQITCNLLAYYFSFWIIMSIYILIGFSCLLFCCSICFTIFISPKE